MLSPPFRWPPAFRRPEQNFSKYFSRPLLILIVKNEEIAQTMLSSTPPKRRFFNLAFWAVFRFLRLVLIKYDRALFFVFPNVHAVFLCEKSNTKRKKRTKYSDFVVSLEFVKNWEHAFLRFYA